MDVLREHYSDLYRALVKSDTCRKLISADLYAKKIVSDREYDKIQENERLHGADQATEEILKRIRTHLSVYPDSIGTVLEVLGREEALKPIVASMRGKLGLPAPPPANGTHHEPKQQGMKHYLIFIIV